MWLIKNHCSVWEQGRKRPQICNFGERDSLWERETEREREREIEKGGKRERKRERERESEREREREKEHFTNAWHKNCDRKRLQKNYYLIIDF